MKKTFKYFTFMLLTLAVLGISLKSWAAVPEPTNKLNVGDIFNRDGDCVTYKVIDVWNSDLGAYPVQIYGVDYDYVSTPPSELTINTVFQWKRGKELVNFYVVSIKETDDSERGAFWAQTNLKKVELVNTLKGEDGKLLIGNDKFKIEVGANAFNGCSNLATLTFPDNVKSIGAYAFRSSAITSFVIPAECQTIGEFAFDNTRQLKTVTVSKGEKDAAGEYKGNVVLDKISQKVFANSYVQELDLSLARNLQEIEDDAFIYSESEVNNQLKKVILPDGTYNGSTKKVVKGGPTLFLTMGSAFANCTALTTIENLEISIVDKIRRGTNSKNSAFENCRSLTELYLPATAWIEGGSNPISAFYGCESLATLKFADGWGSTIGMNIYKSKKRDGLGGTTDLSDAEQKAEKSYLKEVIFMGGVEGGAVINNSAFRDCENLATLTFTKGFVMAAGGADRSITINPYAFAGTALTKVDFYGTSFAGDVNASVTISANSFACDNLGEVAFGKITYAADGTSLSEAFTLENGAFKSDNLKKVTFGEIKATAGSDATYPSTLTIGSGSKVFTKAKSESDDALEEVAFGNMMPGAFTIGSSAFASSALKKVAIESIATTDHKTNGTLNVKANAFYGDVANSVQNEKTVEIGSIGVTKKADGTYTASLEVNFNNSAFAAKQLKTVKIGDVKDGATVTFQANSFANLMPNTDKGTAMTETVTIGQIEEHAIVDVKGSAFQGPSKKESEFVVNIATGKDQKIAGTVKAVNSAFTGPAVGTTTYTFGNIASTAVFDDLALASFAGSDDGTTPIPTNTTSVTIGNVEKAFTYNPFTKVYDATVGKWDVAGNLDLAVFDGVVEATVGDIAKATGSISDLGNTLESLEFTGNVAGDIKTFNSSKVRSIKFTSEDPEVKKGAFNSSSFSIAGYGAELANEQIVVVYKTKTAAKSSAIFEDNAFGALGDAQSVTLYTDEWTKVNIFQNKSIYATGEPYRVSLSASDIVPGEDITATCYTHTGGKYAYGRLYIPAGSGMYYKIDAKKGEDGKNAVTLYWGYNDGTDIYMNPVLPSEGYYYIDATLTSQVLIVRTTDTSAEKASIVAEAATAEDLANPEITWFDDVEAVGNKLRYAPEAIVNQELQNNTEFKGKSIYVMANPKKNGLAFALLNQYKAKDESAEIKEYRDLAKNSIYIVAKVDPRTAAARLNVIWPEDVEEATAIKSVKSAGANDGEIYNLQGVRVNAAYKGVVIKNGKKMIQK
jgi:hypothetical protein